eukprot:gnl/Dysnectes_brevis/2011_a2319_1186.p1 GENE.gnl/Dysnectes_brevis/2011_a2319_1186~~gnl/Dysnectes_brevis/2011_a2319_1186.p1  ORF type:complete len:313 (+),score=74.16 gnl/Dysnectes_brevis/2011_a2319_1186:58-996(+)
MELIDSVSQPLEEDEDLNFTTAELFLLFHCFDHKNRRNKLSSSLGTLIQLYSCCVFDLVLTGNLEFTLDGQSVSTIPNLPSTSFNRKNAILSLSNPEHVGTEILDHTIDQIRTKFTKKAASKHWLHTSRTELFTGMTPRHIIQDIGAHVSTARFPMLKAPALTLSLLHRHGLVCTTHQGILWDTRRLTPRGMEVALRVEGGMRRIVLGEGPRDGGEAMLGEGASPATFNAQLLFLAALCSRTNYRTGKHLGVNAKELKRFQSRVSMLLERVTTLLHLGTQLMLPEGVHSAAAAGALMVAQAGYDVCVANSAC